MKVLSIKQPWASLVASGIKDVENRTWRTKFRGKIYIHAAQKPAFTHKDFYKYLNQRQVIAALKVFDGLWPQFTTSAIIGEVNIVDCVLNHPSVWAQLSAIVLRKGSEVEVPVWNWVLANPVLYDKPILNVKGKLSFWDYQI